MDKGKKIDILIAARNEDDKNKIINFISDQNDINIIGAEFDEAALIIKIEKLKPDVLIIDLQHPGIDGTELAPMVRRRSPSTSIIILSDNNDIEYAYNAINAGVSGFLIKKHDLEKLLPIIRIVYQGGIFINSEITKKILETILIIRKFSGKILNKAIEIKSKLVNNKNDTMPLSVLERNIIIAIAKGYSDKEIAKHLNYNVGSIRNSIVVIKRKLHLKNRVQIVHFSLIYGLINQEITNRQFPKDALK